MTGNQKSLKINRNIDQYGRVIYDVYDLYDMVMSGKDTSVIKEVSWNNDFEKYNDALEKNYLDGNKLEKLERDKNLNQIQEEEIKFLRLNLLYSHKCRKTMFNQLYKVNTPAYKTCILTQEKR